MGQKTTHRTSRPIPVRTVLTELSVVGVLAALVATRSGRRLDDRCFEAIHRKIVETRGGRAASWLLSQGGWFGSAVVAATWLGARGRFSTAWRVLVSASVAWLAAQGLKAATRIERPWDRIDGAVRTGGIPAGTAFPSGHPAVAAAVAAVTRADRRLPASLRIALTLASLAVGVARIGVGAHYPSDVVAGWVLGDACGRLAAASLRASRTRQSDTRSR